MGILDDAIREHLELKRAHGADESELRQKEAEVFGPVRQEVAAPLPEDDATQMLQPADAESSLAPPAEPQDPMAPFSDDTVAHTPGLESEPLQPSAQDPYAVHPGDEPVPDPHDHAHPAGGDPAWGDDTEFFAEPAAPPPAAEQPRAPVQHHDDEPHPALHDRDAIHSEEHAPEPAFRERAEAPGTPETPTGPGPVEDPPVGEPPVEEPPIEEPPVEEPPVRADGEDEDVLEETPEFLQDAPEHDRLWFEQKPPRDFDFGE